MVLAALLSAVSFVFPPVIFWYVLSRWMDVSDMPNIVLDMQKVFWQYLHISSFGPPVGRSMVILLVLQMHSMVAVLYNLCLTIVKVYY